MKVKSVVGSRYLSGPSCEWPALALCPESGP
jgi:hypothetical protein